MQCSSIEFVFVKLIPWDKDINLEYRTVVNPLRFKACRIDSLET